MDEDHQKRLIHQEKIFMLYSLLYLICGSVKFCPVYAFSVIVCADESNGFKICPAKKIDTNRPYILGCANIV